MHRLLGNEVRLVGPTTLVPHDFESAFGYPVKIYNSLQAGLEGVDVVICLRMQLERQSRNFVPSLEEYTNEFGVSESVLDRCCPRSVVLHPGPVNRGVELSGAVVDGKRSLILNQVSNGVAVRMAVLFMLNNRGSEQ